MAEWKMIDGYEMVIGLEVHVELKTRTKIFCSCSTAFGAEPRLSARFISIRTCSIIARKSFSAIVCAPFPYRFKNTEASPALGVSLPFSEKPIFSSHISNSLMGRRPKTSRRAAASW